MVLNSLQSPFPYECKTGETQCIVDDDPFGFNEDLLGSNIDDLLGSNFDDDDPVEAPPPPTIKPSPEQQAIIDAIHHGENIFITGVAGTGKSFVIEQIRKRYPVSVTATTGIAALNVEGSTIHSWAGLGDGSMDPASIAGRIMNTSIPWMAPIRNNIMHCKRLVIDEVSMLSAKLLDTIDFVFRSVRGQPAIPFGGIQVILTGDFLQLPPVSKTEEAEFCYRSEAWHNAKIKTYQLTKVFRQENQAFADCLGRVRVGCPTPADIAMLMQREGAMPSPHDEVVPIRVFSTNAQADTVNYQQLEGIQRPEMIYNAEDIPAPNLSEKQKQMYEDKLNRDCLAPKVLIVKIGAQVMLLKNVAVPMGLVNGSMGTIIDFEDVTNAPIVKFNNGQTKAIGKADWELKEGKNLPGESPDVMMTRRQYPLRLAYAITIHKCQGMSLDRVHCNMDRIFADGQAYVALSRAKSLEGLYLSGFTPARVFANKKALRFYEELAGA